MAEEINATLEPQDSSVDYLKIINDLKANSVSKLDYESVREENRRLLNNIVNQSQIELQESTEPSYRASEDIRNELFGATPNSLTNMKFIELSCELRDAVLAETEGKEDIFTVHKPGEVPSEEALASAERTADVFKQCLESADGDSAMFNAILQQRMQDVSKIGRR